MKTIYLGAGCFWCTEALFQRIQGVKTVKSGYSGGKIKNQTHKQICKGNTGHTQVCMIQYNSNLLPLAKLIKIFLEIHDPTQKKKTQYRSVIFTQSKHEKKTIQIMIGQLNKKKQKQNLILTAVQEFTFFEQAQIQHCNFYNQMKNETYCKTVVQPKLKKLTQILKQQPKNKEEKQS